jgi:hypothetical protein
MIAIIWAKIQGYVAAAGAVLAIIAGAFLYGRSSGKADAKADQAAANAKAAKQARDTENEVQGMDSAGVDAGLSEWLRDGKR